MLALVKLFTIASEPESVFHNEAWKDFEFEPALDFGSVVHICSLADIPRYRLSELPCGRRGGPCPCC